jgi:hypothetical protein
MMLIDASVDMSLTIERMDRENPDVRYMNIIDGLPRMLARGATYEQIEEAMGITIRPEHRLPVAAAAE